MRPPIVTYISWKYAWMLPSITVTDTPREQTVFRTAVFLVSEAFLQLVGPTVWLKLGPNRGREKSKAAC